MKTKLFLSFFLITAYCLLSSAQVPQGFNYQAIAHDGGDPITTVIDVQITIQSDPGGGTTFWIEKHTDILPNESGLFSLVIGSQNPEIGSTEDKFNDIDWSKGTKYIKTEIDNGDGFVTMGTSQLWSVPYSMVSGNVSDTLSKLVVEEEPEADTNALFEVRNRSGQTVFAVYNAGVRIYVDNGTKGKKGGFAIGGFGNAKSDTSGQQYFIVNRDSIRAYIYDDPLVKAAKGGFAIGGFGNAKGFTNDYLLVSPDSTRIYIDNASSTKGKKGGFAIGGFGNAKRTDPQRLMTVNDDSIRLYIDDNAKASKGGFAIGGFGNAKGEFVKFMNVTPDSTRIFTSDAEKGFGVGSLSAGVAESYLKLTPENYFIGHQSGKSNLTGKFNSFLGYQTGLNNVAGNLNTFVGYQAGMTNTGSDNTFIGYLAGNAHQSQGGNVYIGSKAGEKATNGQQNVLIGESVGTNITTGSQNIMMGVRSGYKNQTGDKNVFLGYNSGYENRGGSDIDMEGDYNVFIGATSGYSNTVGKNNVYIGYSAGMTDTSGFDNVYIGYSAASGAIAGPFYKNYRMVAIGSYAGDNLQGAGAGTFLGYAAGRYSTTGNGNTFIGYESGVSNQTGDYNTYVGNGSGRLGTATRFNTFVGEYSGSKINGNYNTFVGSRSGWAMLAGYGNTFIGKNSGEDKTGGSYNVLIGLETGSSSGAGEYNVFIGSGAGENDTGQNNVYIGHQAGNTGTGSGNVFLGFKAGYNESTSDKLYISNSETDTPLIYGEFVNKKVKVNGTVNIRDLFILDEEVISDISDGGTISPTKSNVRLDPAAAVTLSTTKPITDGTYIGQLLILRGSSSTNYVTITDNGNVNLPGNRILHYQDTISLIWDGTSWIQMAFADNTTP